MDELETKEFEVGGVKVREITDKKGRVWSVPADDANVDPREFDYNMLGIPHPEPGFFFQYVTTDRLNEFLTKDFVLVEPDEIGLPPRQIDPATRATALVGLPQGSHHQVGNLHLVKIPEVLAKRMRKAQELRAKAATADIEVPRHMGKPVRQISETDVKIHSRETTQVTGPPIVTSAKEFKDFPVVESLKERDEREAKGD